MKKIQNVIGVGELLWDVLPEGKKPGGAPCNFVYHAQKQGAKAFVLSAVGKDNNGKEILNLLETKGVSAELIQLNDKPTSTVDISLNAEGIPKYTIHEDVAWDFIKFHETLQRKVMQADIVCFGSLAQRNTTSRETIEKILKCCRDEALMVYDINFRQNFYSKEIVERSLRLCNVLKLNEDELPVVCELLDITAEGEEQQLAVLLDHFKLKLAAFTKGSQGSLLMTTSEISYIPTPKVKVQDTVGAGDSFTAVMIMGFANGNSLKEIHQQAVEISAFVCTQNGAMPEYK